MTPAIPSGDGPVGERADHPLAHAIADRSARVGIIGLGYVGLPLVREFCRAGFAVTGFDIDPAKVESLRAGRSYIAHIPHALIAELVATARFTPTGDFAALAQQHVIIICVPTPLNRHREPDLSFVEGTARTIADRLPPPRGVAPLGVGPLGVAPLIVLESTTYPGTTREVVLPLLSAGTPAAPAGRRLGYDFHLAFSPERENPGSLTHTTRTIPKLVGGVDPLSGQLAQALYAAVVDRVVGVSSAEVAEAAKILENIYRAVNIALVNELKMLFDRMGLDIWEVIAAAATKPFGFAAFFPGPGLGGHCIPIDPFYLTWKARAYEMPTRFVELAGEINWLMPDFVIAKLTEALNQRRRAVNGSRILVLGLAYKRDVDDLRESPSVVIIEKLQARGAAVDYHDPNIPRTHKQRDHDLRLVSVPLTAPTLASYDAVLIATDHTAVDYALVARYAALIVDTRNVMAGVAEVRSDPALAAKIVKA